MIIKFTDKYYVEVDNLNWTLKTDELVPTYTDKKGKVIEEHIKTTTLGYYKNFEQTVEALIKYYQNEFTEDLQLSMKEYTECVDKANKMALESFKSFWDKQ